MPPLTISEYRKVINRKLYLYYALANLNTLLCPLVYIIAQAPSKAILITPYRTTLMTFTVTDLINRIVQILRRDLRQVRISMQDMELIEPVEL